MMNKMKKRKAQEASTLTWVVASIAILFMLIIYSAFAGVLFFQKGGPTIFSVDKGEEGFILTKNLINLLNTPVNQAEADANLIDEIKSSLDVYIDNEMIMNNLNGDINLLRLNKETLGKELLISAADKEKQLKKDIEETIGSFCEQYIFEIPNIKVDTSGTNQQEKSEVLVADFAKEIILSAPYKGQTIQIKYRQSKNC